MTTSGSKTPTTCIPFYTNYDCRGRLSNNKLIFEQFLCQNICETSYDKAAQNVKRHGCSANALLLTLSVRFKLGFRGGMLFSVRVAKSDFFQ